MGYKENEIKYIQTVLCCVIPKNFIYKCDLLKGWFFCTAEKQYDEKIEIWEDKHWFLFYKKKRIQIIDMKIIDRLRKLGKTQMF